MITEEINNLRVLEDWLNKNNGQSEYPNTYGGKNYIERYHDLAKYFADFPIDMGALVKSAEDWIKSIEEKVLEISKIENQMEREHQFGELFVDNPLIYLNRHDSSHTKKVMEKALSIIRSFNKVDFSCYEIYFLLCSIVVHDIGNIYGRLGHEKALDSILESNECKVIIPDAVERMYIKRIAGVHGGIIKNNADTIRVLEKDIEINGLHIREQLLAAILRFADELADDATRANYPAMNSNIVTEESRIHHAYSKSLHTVELAQNAVDDSYEVHLSYLLSTDEAKTQFGKSGRYLIDEIYARTIKMERERRYCIRYLRPYCSLERIKVKITIATNLFLPKVIPYTLEERGYPAMPYLSIKDVDGTLMSGEELVKDLQKEEKR